MRRRSAFPTVTTATLVTLGACAPAEPPADLAIANVTVVDAVQGALGGRTVVVDDGRIVRVAAADEVDAGAAAREVIDGTGRYLMPGLWDAHVHLTYDDRFTDAIPGLFLAWGVTSIRDTGGVLEKVLPVVARMDADSLQAPRVFFAGPLLDGEHVVYDGVNNPALGVATPDPDAARARVAELADAGADFIKVYELVTPEVFDALVSEAEARGLPVDGHVPLSMLARDVGPRVNSLEHLRNLELDCAAGADALLAERRRILAAHDGGAGADLRARLHAAQRLTAVADYDEARCDETIAAMAGTMLVPTLRLNALGLVSPFARPDWGEALARLPEATAAPWREAAERAAADAAPARDTTFGRWSLFLTGRLHAAGVPIGAGTDTPIAFAIPGYSLHNELDMLVRAGLSAREALAAATLRPAEFFGLEGEMGTVEAGKVADLVLLSGDPLADIANTRRIEAVVLRGRVVPR